MTDLHARIARLRGKLAATDDPDDRADLEAAIAALEQQSTPLESPAARSHTQQIGGYATIAAAIAGDFTGNLYIIGDRAQSATQALAGYLGWLASQCGQLPLSGVREQKAATDVLHISLDQVYTQLATLVLLKRDRFDSAALTRFDAKAYLEQHVGELLLPYQQRLYLRRPKTPNEQFDAVRDGIRSRENYRLGIQPQQHITPDESDAVTTTQIEILPPDILANIAQQVPWLEFFGPQLVTEAIAASPRLVLLGEAGSGKSTALRYLALMLGQAALDATLDLNVRLAGWSELGEQGKLIPLFMPLLPLAKRLAAQPSRNGTATDLWTAIDTHLINHGATTSVVNTIREELALGHVALLLDGLDEVAGGDSRRQVVRAVQAFAAEQPQCRMVVACRVRAYEGDQNTLWQLPGWPTATLADWTPGQVRAFIGAWYTAAAAASHMPPAKRDERIVVLQHAVTERDDLRRLSIRPLLLTIMALVHLNDGRLPEDRVSLYARCLDILLGQWEMTGKDETVYGSLMQYIDLPDADVRSLRPLLARAAYAAHDAAAPGEVGRLRRAELRELVSDGLEQLKHPNPHEGAKRFLEYTDVRAGLLQATEAGDAYAFPHQTFQEYLAGLELISGVGFVDRIMERRSEDRWRVPIFLGIGHSVSEGLLSAPYQLLSRMLHVGKRDQVQRQRDLIFAAEIAEDVGWDRLERGGDEFSALRVELAKALAQVVKGMALPAAERVQAGVYLGTLGDLREGVCTLPLAMAPIADGSFVIGEPRGAAQYSEEENDQPVRLASFEIARYPVTNAQFKLFMDDNGYDVKRPWWDAAGKQWARQEGRRQPGYWNDERFGIARLNHPVVGVSWYEAIAFCRWLTQQKEYNPQGYVYALPSEAEWEYAARGPARRIYPWSDDEPDDERANFDEHHGGTTTVGCFPSGTTPEGVFDMAGNVWEWIRSVYAPYPYDPNDGREALDDPAEKRFTLRGGSWYYRSFDLRASGRNYDAPDYQYDGLGFRLARHPHL